MKFECPYDYDSCGRHCKYWVLANPRNRCTLKEDYNSLHRTKMEEK